jgi:hypothetical protein
MAKSRQVGTRPTNRVPRPTVKQDPKPVAFTTLSTPEASDAEKLEFANMVAGSGHMPKPTVYVAPEPEKPTPTPEPEKAPEPETPTTSPLMAALRAAAADPGAKSPEPERRVTRGAVVRPVRRPVATPGIDANADERKRVLARIKCDKERLEELLGEARRVEGQSPLTEAGIWARVQLETGLKPFGLALLLAGPQPTQRGGEFTRWWDMMVYRNLLLKMSEEIQQAVDKGEIGSGIEVGELARMSDDAQAIFIAKLKTGDLKNRNEIRKYAAELIG